MTIQIFANTSVLLKESAQHWITLANTAIEERGAFFVALSGGRTPKALYTILAERAEEIDWSRVWLFWSDERNCSLESDQSNYKMAMDAGLDSVGIPKKQILPMPGDSLDAAGYQKTIETIVPDCCFDFIMLGMGDDGHTASLFPNTPALLETTQFVVSNPVPQLNTTRLTFTYPLIEKARCAALYVIGKEKRQMLSNILEKGMDFPAGRVAAQEVIWFLDSESAPVLT